MSHQYLWRHNEANFGHPLRRQVRGGTHITFELILKWRGKYIGLRRPKAIPGHELPPKAHERPQGLLYFCHGLIRYGETSEECIKRIIRSQTGVGVDTFQVVSIDSEVQTKDGQWAFMPHAVVRLSRKPRPGRYGNMVTEVAEFTKQSIPNDFGWWKRRELKNFLTKFD